MEMESHSGYMTCGASCKTASPPDRKQQHITRKASAQNEQSKGELCVNFASKPPFLCAQLDINEIY